MSRWGSLPGLSGMSKRLFLLGATGHTGSHVVDLALARGHHLTAFVRSPHKIAKSHPALTVVRGDPLDTPSLASALRGHDAVLSTLGPSVRETLRPSTRMTDWAKSTTAAMREAGVHRAGVLSAAVLFPLSGITYAFFSWLLKHHARDLAGMEALFQAAPFRTTLARPPRLVQSPDDRYRSAPDTLPAGASTVSFRAVAAFLLDAIESAPQLGVVGVAAEHAA